MAQTNNFPFLETPGTVYMVGGAVRDALLGTPVKDHDWVIVGATPEDMLNAGYQQVGADFPVFLHPETKEEYALARKKLSLAHPHVYNIFCGEEGYSPPYCLCGFELVTSGRRGFFLDIHALFTQKLGWGKCWQIQIIQVK